MNISRLFILRPVATSLLMVAILIAGVLAYRLLPVSALPEVDYPSLQVNDKKYGAVMAELRTKFPSCTNFVITEIDWEA